MFSILFSSLSHRQRGNLRRILCCKWITSIESEYGAGIIMLFPFLFNLMRYSQISHLFHFIQKLKSAKNKQKRERPLRNWQGMTWSYLVEHGLQFTVDIEHLIATLLVRKSNPFKKDAGRVIREDTDFHYWKKKKKKLFPWCGASDSNFLTYTHSSGSLSVCLRPHSVSVSVFP